MLPKRKTPSRDAPGAAHPEASYADALRQGLEQAMDLSDRVVVVGQLVDYAPGVFGSTTGLVERFVTVGVLVCAVFESVMSVVVIVFGVWGMWLVLWHYRLCFMLYSIDA